LFLKFLVQNGADKESEYELNKKPLHLASEKGHFQIVKYLVEKGANIQARTNKGQTPLDLAESCAKQLYSKYNLAENWQKKRIFSSSSQEGYAKTIQFLKDSQQDSQDIL
jgi:ankyrin repeat protein